MTDVTSKSGLDRRQVPRVHFCQEVHQVVERTGGPRGTGLTPALIEYEKNVHGLNQSEIAEKYKTTRQNVSQIKRLRGGYSMTARERVMAHWPWKVPRTLQQCSVHHRMRDHAEYMASGGKGMSDEKLKRLIGFYAKLENNDVVVEFDPELPPSEDAVCGGWRFVPRKDSDADLMVRVNSHTTITTEGHVLWRIPKRRPKVR